MVTDSITTASVGRPAAVPSGADRVDDVLALGDLAEQRVQRLLELRTAAGQRDEELAAVGVRTGVGHHQRVVGVVGRRRRELVLELVAEVVVAPRVAVEVAALDDEAGDDAMERHAVVGVVAGSAPRSC